MIDKVCMYMPHKDRAMSPENIKEHVEIILEQNPGREVVKILMCQEVFDTIDDFKVYFKRARKYPLKVIDDVSNDYLDITFKPTHGEW